MDPMQLAAVSKLHTDIADTSLDEFYEVNSFERLHKLRLAIPVFFERLGQARRAAARTKIVVDHQHG